MPISARAFRAGPWLLLALLCLAPAPLCAAVKKKPAPEYRFSVRGSGKGGRYGYIDETGALVIEARFDGASKFSEGLAAVKLGAEYGYIDVSGNLVIPHRYAAAFPFSEGLARIRTFENEKIGFIDPAGTLVIPQAYERADDFHEGLARVENGGKAGYVNKKGKLVIPLDYDGAAAFSQALALVKKGEDWFFIDAKGKKKLDPEYPSVWSYSEGLAHFSDGKKYGFIDQKGKVAIAPRFDNVHPFSEGLAAVKEGKLWGYIDPSGRWAIEPRFESAVSEFKEGLASVQEGGLFGYIDTRGRFAIRPQFEYCDDFADSLAFCSVEGESGSSYIGKDGRYVWTDLDIVDGAVEVDFKDSSGGFSQRGSWALKEGRLAFSSDETDVFFSNYFPKRIYDSFSFEAEADWEGGAEDFGYGLQFRYRDDDNSYSLDISGNRYFRVSKQVDGEWSDIVPWKKCALIGKTNRLKVLCWPGTTQCYINDVPVAVIREPGEEGTQGYTKLALFSESVVRCSFDDVRIRELGAAERSALKLDSAKRVWDFSAELPQFAVDRWRVADGKLVFAGGEKGMSYNNVPAEGYSADCLFQVDATFAGGDDSYGYGALYRYKNNKNYYDFKISPQGFFRLTKRTDDVVKELAGWTENAAIGSGKNTISIRGEGTNIKCYVNGTLVKEVEDEAPEAGKFYFVGVTSSGMLSCTFDDYTVTEAPVVWSDKE
jgi:hypothetical protein